MPSLMEHIRRAFRGEPRQFSEEQRVVTERLERVERELTMRTMDAYADVQRQLERERRRDPA